MLAMPELRKLGSNDFVHFDVLIFCLWPLKFWRAKGLLGPAYNSVRN